MEIKEFEGYGRTLSVEFKCYRCRKTAVRRLEDCFPSDYAMHNLSDLVPPKGWRNGGFYYPTFCPDCAEKYDKFMKMQIGEA